MHTHSCGVTDKKRLLLRYTSSLSNPKRWHKHWPTPPKLGEPVFVPALWVASTHASRQLHPVEDAAQLPLLGFIQGQQRGAELAGFLAY